MNEHEAQILRDRVMKDHDEIWLEPKIPPPHNWEDRTWSQDNGYIPDDYDGRHATRYVRADLLETSEAAHKEAVNRHGKTLQRAYKSEETIAHIIEALLNANKRRPTLTLRKIHALIGVPFHER